MPELFGERIQLTQMKLSHARGYSDILSDPEAYHFVSESGPVNVAKAVTKITAHRLSTSAGKELYWSIVDNEQNFIGYVALHNLRENEVATSFGIHPRHRRLGFALEAIKLVLAWKGLKGRTITFATHEENRASFGLLNKAGLEYQGFVDTRFGPRHVFACRL